MARVTQTSSLSGTDRKMLGMLEPNPTSFSLQGLHDDTLPAKRRESSTSTSSETSNVSLDMLGKNRPDHWRPVAACVAVLPAKGCSPVVQRVSVSVVVVVVAVVVALCFRALSLVRVRCYLQCCEAEYAPR